MFIQTLARDLTGRADLAEVCANMTTLAEVALRAAVALHHRLLAGEHGEPRDERGNAQSLVVIGMGKLGGGELNVSSDVDLVFVYPEDGETDGARPLSNREFFERLGRRVIGALNDITPDGYVFRVDMRLRPYGDSGPLAVPYSALEHYLITQGRAWERYAWLKARALTGTRHDELHALVTPFVFRKYLDFDAYEGLRDVHRQIREQGKRIDYGPNIKLGPGGIREIEFIVQALQLVRGGREPGLRVRGTLPALAAIAERSLLPDARIAALRDAYVFLRNVEHRLQYRDDRQTQTLPADAAERDALARVRRVRRRRGVRGGAPRAPRHGRRAFRRNCSAGPPRPPAMPRRRRPRPRRPRAPDTTSRRSPRSGPATSRPTPPARRSRRPVSRIPPACSPAWTACARAAATCSCRRCRGNASMRWCRSCCTPRRASRRAAPTRRRYSSACSSCSRR